MSGIIIGETALSNVAIAYQESANTNSSLTKFPFVFCGISRDISNFSSQSIFSMNGQETSISGIAFKEPFQYKIDTLLNVAINATKIHFVFDNSDESSYQIQILQSLLSSNKLNSKGLAVEYTKATTFNDFTSTITNLQNSTTDRYGIIVQNCFKLLDGASGNKSVEPNIVSDWVLANVRLDVMGPVQYGFSYNLQLNQTKMCDYAGILGSQVLDQKSSTISEPVNTQFDEEYLENEISSSKLAPLTNISAATYKMISHYSYMTKAHVYEPQLYVVKKKKNSSQKKKITFKNFF